MPPNENPEQADVVETDTIEQSEIAWAKLAMEELGSEKGNGEPDEIVEEVDVAEGEEEVVKEIVDTDEGVKAIDETGYDTEVIINRKDGTTERKTINDLIKERMLEHDYRQKTGEVAAERKHLEEDKWLVDLLKDDKDARDYLLKRIEAKRDGKQIEMDDDIEIPEDMLAANPWLKKLIDSHKNVKAKVTRYETSQKQSEATQVGRKIDSIVESARSDVEKETGLKLEPKEFHARVGQNILEALDDGIPDNQKRLVIGQLILADKSYYLTKARETFKQERELAQEKSVEAARQKKSGGAPKPQTLKGGSRTTVDTGGGKVVKDAKGKPDLGATIESFYLPKGKAG